MGQRTVEPPRGRADESASGYWQFVHRNLGLISVAEQERLRDARVAIAGLGGVGGGTFLTLCRMGVGRFSIAEPDRYGCSDLNRQQGACVETLERPKIEVLSEQARGINPDVDLRSFSEGLTLDNVDAFLAEADFVVDALDYFALPERQALHAEARRAGLYVSLSAIFGFGTSLVVFSPDGPGFEDLFGRVEGVAPLGHRLEFGRFLFPLTPDYLDLRSYLQSLRGERPIPSFCAPASVSAGLQSMDVVLHLLGKRPLTLVPKVKWLDLYQQRLRIIDTSSRLTRLRQLVSTLKIARKILGSLKG